MTLFGAGAVRSNKSIRDKTMASFDKLQRRFTFTDAAFSRNEHADAVYILVGNAPDLIEHLLEIRGLGIINVMTLFGAGAVRSRLTSSSAVSLLPTPLFPVMSTPTPYISTSTP
jgi:HPr kinase/phosphorylase